MKLPYDKLKTRLSGKLSPLFVLTGNETLLILEAASLIREAAAKAGVTEREVMTADRSSFSWARLAEANSAMSLFGDRKLIELRIPNGAPGREGSAALQAYAAHLNPDNITLITLPELDWRAKKAPWAAALADAKDSVYIEVPQITPEKLPAWIAARFKSQGQEADPDAVAFLAEQAEGNLLAAHQEIQKLGLLSEGRGRISLADVRNSVLNVARFDIFQLNEALLKGNSTRYIKILNGLKGEDAPVPLMLAVIAADLRLALRYRTALDAGRRPAEISKSLKLFGERDRLIAGAAARLSQTELMDALQQAAQIDKISKGLKPDLLSQSDWDTLADLGLFLARA